jgi:hypothetical protein
MNEETCWRLSFEVFARCLTGARGISHRLLPLIGHPDRGEFPGALCESAEKSCDAERGLR